MNHAEVTARIDAKFRHPSFDLNREFDKITRNHEMGMFATAAERRAERGAPPA